MVDYSQSRTGFRNFNFFGKNSHKQFTTRCLTLTILALGGFCLRDGRGVHAIERYSFRLNVLKTVVIERDLRHSIALT